MKTTFNPLLLAAALLLANVSCTSHTEADDGEVYLFTSFHEPATEGLRLLYSADGLHWDSLPGTWLRPELGMNIMRDPSIARGPDGTFHLVWTIAWREDTGFGYASSRDLIHWTTQRRIPAMDSVPSTRNVWAPELFWDEETEQFLIVYASCVVDANFDRGIEEAKSSYRLYYVTTRDFQSFTQPSLLFDPGFSSIDATLLRIAPGDYVMAFKDNTRPERNIKVARAPHAQGPYSAVSDPLTAKFTEGPTICSVGQDYYIYYDAYEKGTYGALKTRDFVHFIDATDNIQIPQGHKHGTVFRAPKSLLKGLMDYRGL